MVACRSLITRPHSFFPVHNFLRGSTFYFFLIIWDGCLVSESTDIGWGDTPFLQTQDPVSQDEEALKNVFVVKPSLIISNFLKLRGSCVKDRQSRKCDEIIIIKKNSSISISCCPQNMSAENRKKKCQDVNNKFVTAGSLSKEHSQQMSAVVNYWFQDLTFRHPKTSQLPWAKVCHNFYRTGNFSILNVRFSLVTGSCFNFDNFQFSIRTGSCLNPCNV